MKTSELIALLQQSLVDNGDLEVFTWNDQNAWEEDIRTTNGKLHVENIGMDYNFTKRKAIVL